MGFKNKHTHTNNKTLTPSTTNHPFHFFMPTTCLLLGLCLYYPGNCLSNIFPISIFVYRLNNSRATFSGNKQKEYHNELYKVLDTDEFYFNFHTFSIFFRQFNWFDVLISKILITSSKNFSLKLLHYNTVMLELYMLWAITQFPH